jgi:hypothetical protein
LEEDDYLSKKYPLKSKKWLLYFGKPCGTEENDDEGNNTVILLPEYNEPKVTNLSSNDIGNYKKEFFFYHDENFIIYQKQPYGIDHVAFDIFNKNLELKQTVKLKIHNCAEYSYAKTVLSPNGRYLFVVEEDPNPVVVDPEPVENNPEPAADSEAVVNPDVVAEPQLVVGPKPLGRLYEFVRDRKNKTFSLKLISTMNDFKERYNKLASDINQYSYYGGAVELFLTDKMELLLIDKDNKRLMYEEINCYDQIEGKFGKQEYNKDENKTLADVTIVCKNGGFAFHSQEEAWFLGINSELRTALPLIRINFQINKGQMTLNRICRCPDPNLIVLDFVKDYISHLILVWDVDKNRERYNFSTEKDFQFINGAGTKAGFILNGATYVNLDTGLINYFFEYEFTANSFYEQISGNRINKKQDLILEYGSVITKETLIEVISLDELILGYSEITEK